MIHRRWFFSLIVAIGALLVGVVLLVIVAGQSAAQAVRTVLASVALLYVPGACLSLAFLPSQRDRRIGDQSAVGPVERFLLSLALSMVAVPLGLYVISLIGVPIQAWSITVMIGVISITGGLIWWYRIRHQR